MQDVVEELRSPIIRFKVKHFSDKQSTVHKELQEEQEKRREHDRISDHQNCKA